MQGQRGAILLQMLCSGKRRNDEKSFNKERSRWVILALMLQGDVEGKLCCPYRGRKRQKGWILTEESR